MWLLHRRYKHMMSPNRILNAFFDDLADEGKKVIDKAAKTNTTRPGSKNMMDAYGAAVYYYGKRVRTVYVNPTPQSTETHKGWKKHNIPSNTGRGYLESWFNSYKPKGSLELVCVNAVYYSQILEEGAQGRPRRSTSTKYRIISQTYSDMSSLAGKYKGKLSIIKA